MKALVFHGPRNVSVDEGADPKIEEPLDAVIRITTANICGSDLHPYEGRWDLDDGMVLGHENMGTSPDDMTEKVPCRPDPARAAEPSRSMSRSASDQESGIGFLADEVLPLLR